jgi:hypothetical protein
MITPLYYLLFWHYANLLQNICTWICPWLESIRTRSRIVYLLCIIKNLSSSTSHKKNCETLILRDSSFFLFSTFIYEPILTKKFFSAKILVTFCYLKILNHLFLWYIIFNVQYFLKLFKNVNIMKTQILYKIKYDLKGRNAWSLNLYSFQIWYENLSFVFDKFFH